MRGGRRPGNEASISTVHSMLRAHTCYIERVGAPVIRKMASNTGAPGFCLVALGKLRRISLARINACSRSTLFCAKRTVSTYASFEVATPFEQKKKMEKSTV